MTRLFESSQDKTAHRDYQMRRKARDFTAHLVKNGNILFVSASLISPMGLPMPAVQRLGKLQDVNTAMKNFIHS